jgi:hypothetical protein
VIRVDHFFKHPGRARSTYRFNESGQHHGISQVWWDRQQLQPRVYAIYRDGVLQNQTVYHENGSIKYHMYIQGNHKIETGFYKNSKRQYIKTWLFDSTSLTWLRHGVWTGWYANGNTTYTETYDTDAMILDKCRYWQVNGTERTEKTLNRKKAVVRITKQPSLFTNEFSDSNSAESSELGEWSEVEQTEDILRDILGNPDDNNFSNSDWKQESDFGFGFGFRLDFKDGEIWNGLKMKEI